MSYSTPNAYVPFLSILSPDSVPEIFNQYYVPAVVQLQAAVTAIATGLYASRCGVSAALSGGTRVVANTSVTAKTVIQLTHAVPGGTMGNLSYTLNTGVGFTINTDNVLDTSTVAYLLTESP